SFSFLLPFLPFSLRRPRHICLKDRHNTPGANCTGSQNLFNACRIPLFTIDKKSFSYLFLSVKCGVMKEW
ncbi:hypothetical protein J4V46_22365, partial [Escherichia coli]